MRNLTKTIAAVSLLVPASAYSLGIGDIKLHSALNQRLDAEIALLLSSGETVADVKVNLASPEKFDEAGVPWSYFLSKIKFTAVTQANGSTVVKLSSKEALREPFLDFLLEVSWATGSLYREFTVLVDPPVAYTQSTIPVIQKPQQIDTSAVISAEKVSARAQQGSRATVNMDGLTKKSDSLWGVAKKTNVHDDVSIEQMMLAIYEANPKAFYKKNVNALMAGKRLDIPERQAILKLSKKQALAAYRQQDNEWRGRVGKKATQQSIAQTELATQLELEAPVVDDITDGSVVAAADDQVSKSVVDSEIKDSIVDTGTEGLAVQAKMEKLEQQLVMMQKMLVLKDEQIASLQNKKVSDAVVKPGIDAKKVTATDKPKQHKPSDTKPVKSTTAVVKKAIKKPKPIAKAKPEADDDMLTYAIGGTGLAILAGLGFLWWRKRQDEDQTDTESMFASASEISLPDSSAEDELSIPIVDDSSSYDVGTVGESSFLSEFTPSDFDAFDTDHHEVDPISEADVYLAYGRYQQAEDLMREAIKDSPERDECKLKLLEIFYANENKTAFEEYAKELVSSGKHEDKDFWSKVTEMGGELDPESPIYADKASFDAVNLAEQGDILNNEPGQVLGAEEDLAATDFDLSVFDDNVEDPVAKEPNVEAADDNALDFDLSVFDIDGSVDDVEVKEKEVVDDANAINFDLDSVALDDVEDKELKGVDIDVDEVESFDFDMQTADPGIDESVDKVGEIDLSAELESESDIDLEAFDFSQDGDKKEEAKAEVEVTEDIESFDFDFDFDADTSVSTSTPVVELNDGVSDLTDMDELETKIDLAKAYIDMGDSEAAKGIAEEVLNKGSSDQKVAAQAILDQIK